MSIWLRKDRTGVEWETPCLVQKRGVWVVFRYIKDKIFEKKIDLSRVKVYLRLVYVQ